ncbi:pirin family protein [Nocardioides sp. JQ2195]|uniref:pirin family protein n=1 Tax=Nocardioides sp. JQ2195 TaxID=2592334 RepID=UPI00143E8ACF|nr:pirin family protein [Nocardioides sp. JQ2195]QIX28355.1 pirin family protein [Nocardioides sp. JQ2195]
MEIHRAGDRFVTAGEGRETRHSFSFGSHYDPANLRFGLLVCHNDELVQPGSGYPDHPHSNLEIVTWVLGGSLRHQDSQGNGGVVEPGRVQAMSAGAGVVHAETVDVASGPTRFLQTWLLPDQPGGAASYSSGAVEPGAEWTPLASGSHPDSAARIGAGAATLWAARLRAGESVEVPEVPHAHLFLASGAAGITGSGDAALVASDAVRLSGEGARVVATMPTEMLLWTFATMTP